MKHSNLYWAPFLCLLIPACAFVRSSENEPLDPAILRQLEPGRTTARQVTELLGGPAQVVELGARIAYRYEHVLTKGAGLFLIPFIIGNADTRSDRVWVFFDENDVLTHYGASFHGHRPQYSLPWEDIYEEGDDDAADRSRPGLVEADSGSGA